MEETFATLVGESVQVFMFASFLALVVERLIELLVKPALPEVGRKYISHTAVLLGILIALAFGVDLITPLAAGLGLSVPYPVAGAALTGAIIGSGSNLLHDLWPGSTARKGP